MRKLILASAFTAMTAWLPAMAADDLAKQMVGTWKLSSYTLQVVGEGVTEPFGPGAKGSLVLTPEGRWMILVTGANRKTATTDAEKAALLGTMLSYTGRYSVDGDRVSTKVDASWNEIYSGPLETQVRFVKMDGEKLVIRTPEIDSAVRPGKRIVATLTWDRER